MKRTNSMLSSSTGKGFSKWSLVLAVVVFFGAYACTPSSTMQDDANTEVMVPSTTTPKSLDNVDSPTPDPREGLKAGLFDAGEAVWNLDLVSTTKPPQGYVGVTNSDLAFKGKYAIQGNYNGVLIWDLSVPSKPTLVTDYLCPASQSDVSVYGNLMFVSGEGLGGRLDCGTEGVQQTVSKERLRGIRIFDISNIKEPKYVSNVQTCRGSHTHSVLKHPADDENVYVYVSGSAPVRPSDELPGCSSAMPSDDPNSALFRIEVIKVPLGSPKDAKIVNSPRIFENLTEAPSHGLAPAEMANIKEAKKQGKFVAEVRGNPTVIPDNFASQMLQRMVQQRGGSGEPTAEDSTMLREQLPSIIQQMIGGGDDNNRGPNQCHDITLYPEIGLAGGACEGYGLLLDISDPASPKRVDAVADSNFSYWHSATFSNDGSKVLFTDEWGGGGQPKCRKSDPYEWGANAIFTIGDNNKMDFKSYYKLPAAQTSQENCVAHNGSMIPIPDREVMVQSWYQGGISIFDWTDPNNPVEIAFHDRGPVDADQMQMGGSWSVYWYNGLIVNSEIARGLDVFKLKPSPYLTENEIAAANSVKLDYLNAQGQPMYKWPDTYALARAYVDQLERQKALSSSEIQSMREGLARAESASGSKSKSMLSKLADTVDSKASSSEHANKMNKLAETVRGLASM